MQNADSGNQFNFCCSVRGGGEQEGQNCFESHSSVKKKKHRKKHTTPPKELEISVFLGKKWKWVEARGLIRGARQAE